MAVLAPIVLAIRFLCELAAVGAVAYWGVTAADGAAGWALGLGAAAVLLLFWGVFVSPKARVGLPRPARLAVELLVWALATAALLGAGQTLLALLFAAAAVATGILNAFLLAEWPRPRPPRKGRP